MSLPRALDGSPSGRYFLQNLRGQGNYGKVYEAIRESDKTTWAIKILPPGDASGPSEVRNRI